MNGWGLFSLVVICVPLITVAIWILNEHVASRKRRKFLQRYEQRTVSGIRERIEHELAHEDTHIIPIIQHEHLGRDPLQDGKISGYLPVPKNSRRYVRQCHQGFHMRPAKRCR